ncbi:asparagine synthase (glutamine-hydrolyzing) [Magnetospirillum sp. UT-4]|uniref:asparagine synthase (glutamine-hydrolyzing) n=1 Tax=Magnetospirillum sp. UT-4 TaxID=2681467 RepID=UPI0013816F63|nr:asparagine synthase (glutamine-hydrolyzing) [Magnetospirillum sp. UT-4]CAA7621658.1 Asparagine synthetase [Magnetospirillum sp. UT-4]
MCGLAAVLARPMAPPVDAAALTRSRDAMVARGPDGAGLWLAPEGRVGLAHRRLAIIELSESGAQPMASSCGRLRIVFNGEIYNYRALRAGLEAEGVAFRSGSDTEVILALYRRHGRDMLPLLRGMFAFALWDEDRQGMLLARDQLGIKPLYVADDGKTLRAASQVKALLAGGGIDSEPDPAGHAGFFLWGHVPEPHTLYRHIRALPAGSWLWAGAGGDVAEGRFFDLGAELANPRGGPAPGLRAVLLDSMNHHLEADVPVGVFLSAGLDSTTLAALASECAGGRVRTLTLGFDEFAGTAKDEVPLAEAVARHYDTDHTTARVTAADFAACRDRILADMDQPSVDGVNTWFVARATRAAGLKVALSGLGGDELFAGYNSFQDIPRMVSALAPLRLLPGLGKLARVVSAPWIARFAPPKAASILELGTRYGDAYLLRRGLFMPWELPQVMDPDMARAGWRALAPRLALNGAVAGIAAPRLKVSALEMSFYMRNQLLRDSDWAGMAHSLEIRVPLVDVEVLRAVLAMTPLPGKRDMAASARPALPAAVLGRAKTGFFVPVAQWLGESSLRGWACRVYGSPPSPPAP